MKKSIYRVSCFTCGIMRTVDVYANNEIHAEYLGVAYIRNKHDIDSADPSTNTVVTKFPTIVEFNRGGVDYLVKPNIDKTVIENMIVTDCYITECNGLFTAFTPPKFLNLV